MLLMDLMKQMELNWWNGKGGIDGINELMELIAWKQGRNVNWFMEIMAVMKQLESIVLMESLNLVEQ